MSDFDYNATSQSLLCEDDEAAPADEASIRHPPFTPTPMTPGNMHESLMDDDDLRSASVRKGMSGVQGSWDEIRERARGRNHSKTGSMRSASSMDRSLDLEGHKSVVSGLSVFSHPAGRWEKEGEFLVPCECYQRMPRWKKGCCVSGVFFAIVLVVMIPVTFLVIIPGTRSLHLLARTDLHPCRYD